MRGEREPLLEKGPPSGLAITEQGPFTGIAALKDMFIGHARSSLAKDIAVKGSGRAGTPR